MAKLRLAFRFDASPAIGVGHAMRCLAIIEQACVENALCIVLSRPLPDFISRKLAALNVIHECLPSVKVIDQELECVGHFLTQYLIQAVVLDGYQFHEGYRKQLKNVAKKVIVLDDLNNSGLLYADIVLNAVPLASQLGYEETAPEAKLLPGLEYSLLRQEFITAVQQEYTKRNFIVVCFGGSDPKRITLKVVQALAEFDISSKYGEVVVIAGEACLHWQEIQALCEQHGYTFIHQCDDMPSLLGKAKLAIAAPGGLVYELAYSQTPSVFFTVADNQKLSAQAHEKEGWCIVADGCNEQAISYGIKKAVALLRTPERLAAMSAIAKNLVDGYGGNRVIEEIKRLVTAKD